MRPAKRCFQTVLVDGFNGRRSHFQPNPLSRRFDEKPLALQVRIEFTLRLIVGVGNIVARPCALSCDLTNSGHYRTIFRIEGAKVANSPVLCNSSVTFLESVGAMATPVFAAISPFGVVGRRKNNVAFRRVVIIVVGQAG